LTCILSLGHCSEPGAKKKLGTAKGFRIQVSEPEKVVAEELVQKHEI